MLSLKPFIFLKPISSLFINVLHSRGYLSISVCFQIWICDWFLCSVRLFLRYCLMLFPLNTYCFVVFALSLSHPRFLIFVLIIWYFYFCPNSRMHRQPEHVMTFLLAEMGTSGSLDGQQRLVVKGRFAPKNFEGILRRYVSKFHLRVYWILETIATIIAKCGCKLWEMSSFLTRVASNRSRLIIDLYRILVSLNITHFHPTNI